VEELVWQRRLRISFLPPFGTKGRCPLQSDRILVGKRQDSSLFHRYLSLRDRPVNFFSEVFVSREPIT
jgi:hypothetical protein